MLTQPPIGWHRVTGDQRGAVLVITVVVMLTLLVAAAWAVDEGIWFVHHSHLQTEADAAALAGAQNFQFPCSTEVEQKIKTTVEQYGGVKPWSGKLFNEQVPIVPTPSTTYSSTQHNLVSQLNQSNFINQSQPNDTELSGSPCADAAVDVKLSETNLPSFLPPFLSAPYITAQARVSILQETSSVHAEPFAEPLPTPNTMTATLVDESNNDAAIAGPVTLTPSAEHTTWTSSSPVTFSNSKTGSFPVGLRIAMSGGGTATCGSAGVSCYDNSGSTPGIGVTYTRVWSNTGTPGLPLTEPVAPQASDVTIEPSGSTACLKPGGTFSNFISSSSNCTVAVASKMVFSGTGGTPLTCSTASLTLNKVAVSCPAGGPNGTWTSAAVTVPANAGPMNFTLEWTLTAGNKPAGATGGSLGKCTEKAPCKGSLGVVQRAYSGAYDSLSVEAAGGRSGPILGATVADSSGNAILSVARGTAENVNITVNVLGFQDSQTIPSAPVELSFGGNQANAALECGGNAGNPELETALAEGCYATYGTTSAPAETACLGTPEPPVCVNENPGNGKLEKDLDRAMNQRINEGRNTCVNPNHWASPNTVGQVVTQSPPDPRLIITIITDYGALSNGTTAVPIRTFAEFYVTGWAGDKCIGQPNGTSSNGLAYTTDSEPTGENPKGVLLGHFVKYVSVLPTGTGSGACSESAFGNCIAILTR
jgi:Flp pilus assembly protein TadG